MLSALKWLMLLLLFLLIFLLGMFFQMAECEAATEPEASKINSATATEVNVIDQVFSGYEQIQKQSSCSSNINNKKEGFYIFISLNMPESLLEQYDVLAKKIGAKLILRGFRNNSFKETANYLKTIKDQGIAIEIDPMTFKKFSITSVPSFVLSDNNKFDKLVGNVSIKYALEQFEQQGDLKNKASEYLARMK